MQVVVHTVLFIHACITGDFSNIFFPGVSTYLEIFWNKFLCTVLEIKILFSFQNHFIIKMSILLNPVFILTTALMTFVVQVMRNYWFDVPLLTDGTSTEIEMDTIISRNLNILQSHPRCGLTSGGREECWWGCERHPVNGYKVIFIHN